MALPDPPHLRPGRFLGICRQQTMLDAAAGRANMEFITDDTEEWDEHVKRCRASVAVQRTYADGYRKAEESVHRDHPYGWEGSAAAFVRAAGRRQRPTPLTKDERRLLGVHVFDRSRKICGQVWAIAPGRDRVWMVPCTKHQGEHGQAALDVYGPMVIGADGLDGDNGLLGSVCE